MAPKSILLMRHAEKPADPMDPGLSDAGLARARELAAWLPRQFGKPDFLIVASVSKHSARPLETIKPLARLLGLPIDATFADQDYPALAHELLTDHRYAGALVLVCWHHGHIPSLASDLRSESGRYPDPWDPEVFDLILRLDYGEDEKPIVTQVTEPF
jgi:broad specificity phosphatase PhoE